jgi:pimeloyl-ACP methyl ester carboxylesterase
MGESDKPLGRYSTSEMAKDVLEIVDHLGWTGRRDLNVVGVSMGGMIAQELALMIPDRIASLILSSTAARVVNTVVRFSFSLCHFEHCLLMYRYRSKGRSFAIGMVITGTCYPGQVNLRHSQN